MISPLILKTSTPRSRRPGPPPRSRGVHIQADKRVLAFAIAGCSYAVVDAARGATPRLTIPTIAPCASRSPSKRSRWKPYASLIPEAGSLAGAPGQPAWSRLEAAAARIGSAPSRGGRIAHSPSSSASGDARRRRHPGFESLLRDLLECGLLGLRRRAAPLTRSTVGACGEPEVSQPARPRGISCSLSVRAPREGHLHGVGRDR